MSLSPGLSVALKDLCVRLADDKLIMGMSLQQWLPKCPNVEIHHVYRQLTRRYYQQAGALFQLVEEISGETLREREISSTYRNCQFASLPINGYADALIKQYLFDQADAIRLESLQYANHAALQQLALSFLPQAQAALAHSQLMIPKLALATSEAHTALQNALSSWYPASFGIFEPSVQTNALTQGGIQELEDQLLKQFRTQVPVFVHTADLHVPDAQNFFDYFGGRSGHQIPELEALLLAE